MLFTTIAYQLAILNGELAEYIAVEVKRAPRLAVDAPLERQFQKLILEPFIDGLDECVDKVVQISILHLLAKAVRHDGFPLGFFLTSRPELHLQEVWDTEEIIFATNLIFLANISEVSQDIRTVLQSGFSRILNDGRFKVALKSVSRPWPSSESIERLVQQSSGQFIYASTVMKYISSSDHNPNARLEIGLGIQDRDGTLPLADLDPLYHEILSRVEEPERTTKVLGYILAIKDSGLRVTFLEVISTRLSSLIGTAMIHNQHRLLLVIEQLLSLPHGEAYFVLNQLHSLIALKVGSESYRRNLEIQFRRRSFCDFLTAKERSRGFHVDVKAAHFDLAQSCLEFMARSSYKTAEQHAGWIYAFFQWHIHLHKSGQILEFRRFELPLQRFFSSPQHLLNTSHLTLAQEVLGIDLPRFSANFHCTSNDYADAYAFVIRLVYCRQWDVISILNGSVDTTYQSSVVLTMWIRSLHNHNPPATPALLTSLEDAARCFHDHYSNTGPTQAPEKHLLTWLKKLPNPPARVINAWKKAFDKARGLTGNSEIKLARRSHSPT
ncbi:hypothetical protein BDQ17DRAFT_1420785 [Cyathus striatus]|nr:hypothetical protein BDQ17DRAFT_1420785 [Cyathus striatus]